MAGASTSWKAIRAALSFFRAQAKISLEPVNQRPVAKSFAACLMNDEHVEEGGQHVGLNANYAMWPKQAMRQTLNAHTNCRKGQNMT